MSLKLRLLLATISLVLCSIVLMGVISVNVAVREANIALTDSAKNRLTSQNVQTVEALDEYFDFITSQIKTKAFNLSLVEAAEAFIPAYNQYTLDRGEINSVQFEQLSNYYLSDFTKQYNTSNLNPIINAADALSELNKNALALQYDFIAASSFPLGEKDGLTNLGNSSAYSQAHSKYHPDLHNFLQEFGYYDIFIADINNGNIVYSVFKELDYGTSIKNGPYANSGIGYVFDKAVKATEPGQVFYSDLKKYRPSYDAIAGFASTPIFSDGKPIAVLIFQMPLEKINGVLTHHESWEKNGFGKTGETYLLNKEGYLLSESRSFIENQKYYIEKLKKTSPSVAKEMEAKGTTVGLQPAESEASQRAFAGERGFDRMIDYHDVEVFSYYSPIKIGEFNFALLAEMEVEEALKSIPIVKSHLITSTLIESVVILGLSILVILWFASRLIKPLEELGNTCEELSAGEGDLTIQLKASGIPEVDRISDGFNTFVRQIRDIIAQIKIDADSLSSASQELTVITSESSDKTQHQRDQTHMVSTAMKQLSEAVSDVSKSTLKTSQQSIDAQSSLHENMERADLAADNIKLLVQLIDDSSSVIFNLKDEVNQITTVLNVITSIADQTNLLALNAAIEAARAGEAGRGFSVVADEVRALATRSRESTIEISNLVEVMNQSANKSVNSMERATEAASGGIHLVDLVTIALDELSENLKQVLQLTDTVATATEEQSHASASVVQSVESISELAKDVESGSEQTSEAAQSLAKIAEQTRELVARFKV
ncbi:methyl-accepting chemotaxis protein [uncultured Paraglaciecola sp.]|uniref:methyl-accepting chemotaxis protein n=1 Tax=uncultured Paraglaciecola sp. TaxID=1765024 RepID=UPI0025941EA3|nr:methyl-accepting chemotaxis protein [uncultured Paraglaciecola sp.]